MEEVSWRWQWWRRRRWWWQWQPVACPFFESIPERECASVYHERKSSNEMLPLSFKSIALNAEVASDGVIGSPSTWCIAMSSSSSMKPSPVESASPKICLSIATSSAGTCSSFDVRLTPRDSAFRFSRSISAVSRTTSDGSS